MLLLGNKNFLRRHPDTYTPSTQLLLRIYESLLYVPLNVQNCLTEFFSTTNSLSLFFLLETQESLLASHVFRFLSWRSPRELRFRHLYYPLKTIAPSRLYGLVFYNPFYEIHNRKTKELEEWGLGYNSVICTFYPGVFKSWIIRAYLGIKATPLKLILWFVRLHTEKGLILLSLGRKKGWIQSL